MKTRLHYGFWIVAVYCLIVPCIFLFSNPIGLYMVPICEELGVPQGVYSLSRTFTSVLCAGSYIFYVPLQKRFGVRILICMGIFSGVLSAFFYSTAGNLAMIFLAAAFSAFINPLAHQVSMGNMVNAWFAKRNATILSVIFACGNLGGFFNAKLIAYWISAYGWRNSMRNTMFILISIMVVAFLVLRDSPSAKGLRPWGMEAPAAGPEEGGDPPELPGARFLDTRHHPKYCCLLIWSFLTGIMTYPVINVVPALLSSLGYDTIFSGTAVSLLSVGSLILLPVLGITVDKWGSRSAIVCCEAFYLISIFCFLILGEGQPFIALAANLTLGIANILFPLLPMFIKEVFGFRDYSQYMSQANIVRMLGTAIGYPLLGFAHDLVNSYNLIFVIFALLSLIMLVSGIIATGKREPLWVETRPGYSGYQKSSAGK